MIDPKTTLEELRKLPLSEVLKELTISPAATVVRRYGPFGNLFLRPMDFPEVGSVVSGHTHKFDHVTWLSRGSVVCRAQECDPVTKEPIGPAVERAYQAPAAILIARNFKHEFVALEPGTRADCIFALRDFDGKPSDHWNGDLSAYQ